MALLQRAQLERVLERAAGAARALHDWHGSQGVHGGLEPQSFVFTTERQTRLLPPRHSAATHSTPLVKPAAASTPTTLAGVPVAAELSLQQLRYAAPEQAGCLAPTSPRSDLYSLGLILYEWLLLQPAFASCDMLELAYQQLRMLPAAPHRRDAAIPLQVSDLVMRLLAKSALERYASAQALAQDLEQCLQQLRRTGRVPRFALASFDAAAQLVRPTQLYGRAAASSQLLQHWQDSCAGAIQLCLLSGVSGIGKTALAQALEPEVLLAGGHLVRAQFTARANEGAHAAWIAVARGLLHAQQHRTAYALAPWLASCQQTLGVHLPVLLEALPDMQWFTGAQLPAERMHGLAEQARQRTALLALLRAFCQEDRPLVVVLDDAQWADAASIALLRDWLLEPGAHHLLLVLAWRAQADADHPVARLLVLLEQRARAVASIRLQALHVEDVAALLSECCPGLHHASAIAARLLQESQGVPGLLWQRLQHWALQGQLRYDMQQARWCWSAAQELACSEQQPTTPGAL